MDFEYASPSIDVSFTLHNAQLIANTFSQTLENNNCLLMLAIGLHQDIASTIKDAEELIETVSDTNNNLDPTVNNSTPAEQVLESLQSAIEAEKERCFNCKLEMPKLNFNMDLEGVLGNLKVQLNAYTSAFKFDKLDMCQASYALQDSCIPDLLKLITLLLTAYVSIMSLRKLSSISINAFIKGVLSTLLSKLLGSLKVTVNVGSTNISCLINALKEIALAVPTQQNIQARLNESEQLALGLIDANNQSTDSNILKLQIADNLSKSLTDHANVLDEMEEYLDLAEKRLNEAFEIISNVVDNSIKEVSKYIQSLLSFQTYFECETKRSGMDVLEAIQTINQLIQTINLLSSICLSIAKKSVREDACKTKDSINTLSKEDISDLQTKDIIEDYNQKVTEIIDSNENGLEVLIHDLIKEDALPKISLLDCSIDDFIEAHTLPNIINVAKRQVENENKSFTPTDTSQSYIFKKPSTSQREIINNIVDILYDPPTPQVNTDEESNIIIDIKNPMGKGNISDILSETIRKDPKQVDLKCRSIDDVLEVLKTINR